MISKSQDTLVSISGNASDDMEMQERCSVDVEEGKRLLPTYYDTDDLQAGTTKVRVEWHLRTPWAIFAAFLTVLVVLALMISFAKYLVVDFQRGPSNTFKTDFRRPSEDYVLDANWDFSRPSTIREYRWTISDRVANPDGVFRSLLTINGQFPGPLIECNEGDTLRILVENQSSNATSIHFHGIYQNGTNWMDGTVGVTQCPIAPKETFVYEFTLNGQSGTYYYHGHLAGQVADGLYGPLVIHRRGEEEGLYETDHVILIQDYYHDPSSSLLMNVLEPGNEGAPIPNGVLINGRNVRDCESSAGRLCDITALSFAPLDITSGKNHRLRFINVAALAWFEVSLDEHNLALIEVDGTDVRPVDLVQIHVGPGQRYSALITANQDSGTSFWLQARMITHCFTDPDLPGPGLDVAKAVVNYVPEGARHTQDKITTLPTSKSWEAGFAVECRDMNNTAFSPLLSASAPASVDHSYYLRTNIEIGDWRLERGVFNKSSFRPDIRHPSLHRVLDGLHAGNTSFSTITSGVDDVAFHPDRELVIRHDGIQVIDLIVQNFDEGNHPMHLHGHKYWVLAQGHGYFPGYDSAELRRLLDLSNPVRRDTASVEGFGWLLLRFVTDNPGMWAFHCHMVWHSEAGLAMQFLSQPEAMREWLLPEGHQRMCGAEGLERGAVPKDETWYGSGDG